MSLLSQQKKTLESQGFETGADRETRTPDPLITNHLDSIDFIVYNQSIILISKAVFQSSYHNKTSSQQPVTREILFLQSDILRNILKKFFVP